MSQIHVLLWNYGGEMEELRNIEEFVISRFVTARFNSMYQQSKIQDISHTTDFQVWQTMFQTNFGPCTSSTQQSLLSLD